MTTGEGTEPSLWPAQAHTSFTAPALADGTSLEEAEDLPGGLTGSGGASWESTGSVAEVKENMQLPYPSLAPVVFFWLHQSTRPRSWCLALVSTWFERVSMLVILLNCVTLGMFQPCQDLECHSDRCSILQAFDDFIFAFFAVEMVVKMVALGVFGPKCYLGDTWNRLDLFIVMAGMLEYSLDGHNVSFSAIRTVRVLRPLRAINRVPSMRILVTLLLDTLPMLGNVLLLCFFVFFIFGIVGVQLWAGLLRNRCFFDSNIRIQYYRLDETDDIPFICSTTRDNGMLHCSNIPKRRVGGADCELTADNVTDLAFKDPPHHGCVNWNLYYNNCNASEHNPHKGAINFDNIGYAWIAIFQVITLEGWVDIMYYVMDAHSFYNFIYFIFLIIVGSFFMINLCLVVIATQFSETKQRENQLMQEQRARFRSNESTLASLAEPGSCYEEMLKYLVHICRKLFRHATRLYGELCHKRRRGVANPSSSLPVGGTNGYWSRCRFCPDYARRRVSIIIIKANYKSSSCPICAQEGDGVNCDSTSESDPEKQGPDISSEQSKRNQDLDEKESGNENCVCMCVHYARAILRRIVDSEYFNRGIMIAILINTLSMGVEYHEQPDELTDVLEISNIVFTSLFALEMLLKLSACGLFDYISNLYNIFDGIIVIISVCEIVGQADGGFSVLRTFRLLRVLKLVRFLPALRRQLVVLMKTMDNVATFCMLLMLFIFIFSILGMHLFGCKFTLRLENGDTVSDRKNFDSLLWAIVTVFQILTQEDWNVVLYNGMASTSPWAALYFVALMTFGNYVLFNLLVAILVEGFQAEVRCQIWCLIVKRLLEPYKPQWCRDHEDWSLYLFSPQNKFRMRCQKVITHKMFDHIVLFFIFLNCITIALERPDIQPDSTERMFLKVSNYIFTVIFVAEMTVKVVSLGLYAGPDSYLKSSWNVLDGLLVFVSIVDILVSLASSGGNRILGILRVLRLLRTLRPLRVISRAPGLKLVVETLITSLRPIGNIVLICCAFFIVFGILGVQLFKGKFYHCEGFDTRNITNKSECLQAKYKWVHRKYNFDNLDGWVSIMYDGLDAVAVDQQPIRNHNPWMLLYFISFLLIVSFFVLNMFVGVVVENFHKCRQDQEEEEARLREEKRQKRMEKKRRKALQRPYYADYSPTRLYIHTLCTSHYLDLFITIIIAINVLTMSMEHYRQPKYLDEGLKYCNYFFTLVFVIEAALKLVAFGFRRFFKERWNQLDLAIVLLSIMGITLEEIDLNASLPINPTIIRIMRVLRIARVLKLLKMATGMRSLLDTVVQALPQVSEFICHMLYSLLFTDYEVCLCGFILDNPCEGLSRHATFQNFGMAFLTLFRISTGDNWNGIMKDTLRECKNDRCLSYLPLLSPLYFVTFVLMAQFVLVNVVVAVLMKHLEESNKDAREDAEMEAELKEELHGIRTQSTTSVGGAIGLEGTAVKMETLSHEQVSSGQDTNYGNFLTVSRPSLSRMLSLPNDSYMLYPVKPVYGSIQERVSKQDSTLPGDKTKTKPVLTGHGTRAEREYD
uniref:Voltage-dependent T-type calcium channel subunit alpha n=1 Tax=Cyprinus carpio TaxID=7962 RepID=A0A8C1VF56_CYPCA